MDQLIDLRFMRDRDQQRPGRTAQHHAQPVVILDVGADVLQAEKARAIGRGRPRGNLLGETLRRGGDNPSIGRADSEHVGVRSSGIGGHQLGRQIKARHAPIGDGYVTRQVGSAQPQLPIA